MKVCEGLYGYGGGVGVSLRKLRGLRGDVCFGLHWPASCAFIAQMVSYTRLFHAALKNVHPDACTARNQ